MAALTGARYITLDESRRYRANGIPYSTRFRAGEAGKSVQMVGSNAVTMMSAIRAAVGMRVTIVTITTTCIQGGRG
ncbi:MAG: hypothetical protein ABIW58_00240 [Sphingomicrobium sp.]